jgi:hypothetical protein
MTKTAPRPAETTKRFAREPREPKPPRKWGAGTIALITAVLALVSAGVGIVFDLKPDLRPDPRTTLSADISVFGVERNVTTEDWLRRVTRSDRGYRAKRDAVLAENFEGDTPPTPDEIDGVLKAEGELAYVKTHIVGFKRRSLTLRWSIYDARKLRRIQDLANGSGAEIVGLAPSDTSVSLVFLPMVVHPGQYFARFELVDPKGVVLAVADSQKFPGLS